MFIAQELKAIKRAQEEAVVNKKKTPTKWWGVDQATKLLCLARDSSEDKLPPIYTALAAGERAIHDRNISQNSCVAIYIAVREATCTTSIVTPGLLDTLGLWSLLVSALSHIAMGLLSSMPCVVEPESWQKSSSMPQGYGTYMQVPA